MTIEVHDNNNPAWYYQEDSLQIPDGILSSFGDCKHAIELKLAWFKVLHHRSPGPIIYV